MRLGALLAVALAMTGCAHPLRTLPDIRLGQWRVPPCDWDTLLERLWPRPCYVRTRNGYLVVTSDGHVRHGLSAQR